MSLVDGLYAFLWFTCPMNCIFISKKSDGKTSSANHSMKKNNSEFLTVAIEAALQAGDLLRKGFGTSFEISSKPGRHNLVTHFR
jgi:hypothetical protein